MENLTLRRFVEDVSDAGLYSVLADDSGNYIWLGKVNNVVTDTPLLLDFELRSVSVKEKYIVLWDTYNDLQTLLDE